MKRLLMLCVTSVAVAVLGACGSGEVVVQAQRAGADGAPVALKDLEIFLLPYDRDVIFDSLQAAYPEPEPVIPDSLIALQEAVVAAKAEYDAVEIEWSVLRDSLQTLSESMDAMGPAGRTRSEYVLMYRDFQALEPRFSELDAQLKRVFDRYDSLQRSFVAQAKALEIRRNAWADGAFASVDEVIAARLAELKRPELADTTTAAGTAHFKGLDEGTWWVHARYDLPFHELYWNVPIEVKKGEPVQVTLSEENAEKRLKL